MRVLLIEDDSALGSAVRDHAAADGHAVDWAQRLDSAADHLAVAKYELILLDLMLPDGGGVPFLKALRMRGDATPVVILTSMDRIGDRIDGLDAGADDYLVKPFDLAELSARIRAVARRHAGGSSPVRSFGALTVDFAARRMARNGAPVALSAREWALFEALAARPGVVLSRTQLEERLYPFGEEVDGNAIEAQVSRLRRKLGRDVVETLRGVGYRLGSPS